MKICQISDIHWRGITRHEEYTDSFNRLFAALRLAQPDLIINTGDTYHSKTQNITPEVIGRLAWMFRSLSEIAPTIHILGNHDGNLTNSVRQDTITPIHDSLGLTNSFLIKKSGSCPLAFEGMFGKLFKDSNIVLHVYSPFDLDGWADISPIPNKVNVALFHGPVRSASTDMAWKVDGESNIDVGFFFKMDFVLLGDIHKFQSLSKRLDKDKVLKTWIAYPGSLIQQNHGEDEAKGYLIWDIRDKTDWDINFHVLENKIPFLTFPWKGNVFETIQTIKEIRGHRAFLPGTRYRISSSQPVSDIESEQIFNELKARGASEIAFKYEFVSRLDTINTDTHHYHKSALSSDPKALYSMYRQFMEAHVDTLNIPDLAAAEPEVRKYIERLSTEIEPQNAVEWSIKSIEFENLFRYGEGNKLDFTKLSGITGLFGLNRIGKSSVVGAIMYALFNTTDRGPMKSAFLINNHKKHCSAKIQFSIGDQEYVIERQTVRNIPKKILKRDDLEKTNTMVNFYKVGPAGELVEQNSISRDDTDKDIRKLIGNPTDFLMTALSRQGDISSFIDAGSTQRKSILSRFLELDVLEKIHSYAKEDFTVFNEQSRRFSKTDWTNQIAQLNKDIVEIKQSIDGLEVQLVSTVEKMDSVRLWLNQHEQDAKTVADKTLIETQIQQRKLELEQTQKLKSSIESEIQLRQNDLDSDIKARAEINVDELLKTRDYLQSLSTQVIEIGNTIKIEQTVLENQKKSVKRLELVPCGDRFPECHFIKDSHQDKKNLDEQIRKVNKLTIDLASLKATMSVLVEKKIEDSLARVAEYDKRIQHNTMKLPLDQENLRLTDTSLQMLQVDLDEKMAVLVGMVSQERLEIVTQKQALLTSLKADSKKLENTKQSLYMALGGKQDQLSTLEREKEESKGIFEQLKLYDSLQQAFSKTGIPAMILKSQLPAINNELVKILSGVIDFKVSLETDTNSNTMDVYIEDSDSRRIIEVASGMEKMISSLALRVALLNLSSLPRPDILIIDEGFGALDEENVVKCMELLSFLKNYFKTILIITHVSALKDIAENSIEIKYDGKFSKIDA